MNVYGLYKDADIYRIFLGRNVYLYRWAGREFNYSKLNDPSNILQNNKPVLC